MEEDDLKVVISAQAKFKGVEELDTRLKKLEKGFTGATKKSKTFGMQTNAISKSLGALASRYGPAGLATAAVLGLGAAVISTTRDYIKFDKSMANVNTLLNNTPGQLRKVKQEVIELSKATGKDTGGLALGLYDVVSAGVKAKNQIKVLGESTHAASAGVTDINTAAKGGISVINAYGMSMEDLNKVYDLQFQTVKDGILTYGELTAAQGDILSSAKKANVALETIYGSMAFLTKNGISAAESGTALARSFDQIVEKSDQFSSVGINIYKASGEMKDFKDIMNELAKTVDGMSDKQRNNVLKKLGFNVRAAKAVNSILGNVENFNREISKMSGSAGAMEGAYAKSMDSMSAQWSLLIGDFKGDWMGFVEDIREPIIATIKVTREYYEDGKKIAKFAINPGIYIGHAIGSRIRSDYAESHKKIQAPSTYDYASENEQLDLAQRQSKIQEEKRIELDKIRIAEEIINKQLELQNKKYEDQIKIIIRTNELNEGKKEDLLNSEIQSTISSILELEKQNTSVSLDQVKILEDKLKYYKKELKAIEANKKAIQEQKDLVEKVNSFNYKVDKSSFKDGISSTTSEEAMKLIDADILKKKNKEAKIMKDNIQALQAFGQSMYNVADLMDSKLLKSIAGVANAGAGMAQGYNAFTAEGATTGQKVGAGIAVAGSGAGLGGAVGHNQQGAAIGSAIGTGIGAFFGPAGMIAGSAIGGIAGGLIGPKDHTAKHQEEWARDSAEAARVFREAVNKFAEGVHKNSSTTDVMDKFLLYEKNQQDRSTILSIMQNNRTGGAGHDTIYNSAYARATQGLTAKERNNLFKTYGGSGHIEWKGNYGISTGKGRGGVDTGRLATGIHNYYETQKANLEKELDSILGITQDSIIGLISNGIITGAKNSENSFRDTLSSSISSALSNENKGLSKQLSDAFRSASLDVAKDGIISVGDVIAVKEAMADAKAYEESSYRSLKDALEQVGLTIDEAGNIEDKFASATASLNEGLKSAFSDLLDGGTMETFGDTLNSIMYKQALSGLTGAMVQANIFKNIIKQDPEYLALQGKLSHATTKEELMALVPDAQSLLENFKNQFGVGRQVLSNQADTLAQSNYIGEEASKTVIYNQYYYQPSVENSFGETKEMLFLDFEDWKGKLNTVNI